MASVEDKEIEQTSEDASNSYNEEDANINEPDQIESQTVEITSEWLKANTEIHGWLFFFSLQSSWEVYLVQYILLQLLMLLIMRAIFVWVQ